MDKSKQLELEIRNHMLKKYKKGAIDLSESAELSESKIGVVDQFFKSFVKNQMAKKSRRRQQPSSDSDDEESSSESEEEEIAEKRRHRKSKKSYKSKKKSKHSKPDQKKTKRRRKESSSSSSEEEDEESDDNESDGPVAEVEIEEDDEPHVFKTQRKVFIVNNSSPVTRGDKKVKSTSSRNHSAGRLLEASDESDTMSKQSRRKDKREFKKVPKIPHVSKSATTVSSDTSSRLSTVVNSSTVGSNTPDVSSRLADTPEILSRNADTPEPEILTRPHSEKKIQRNRSSIKVADKHATDNFKEHRKHSSKSREEKRRSSPKKSRVNCRDESSGNHYIEPETFIKPNSTQAEEFVKDRRHREHPQIYDARDRIGHRDRRQYDYSPPQPGYDVNVRERFAGAELSPRYHDDDRNHSPDFSPPTQDRSPLSSSQKNARRYRFVPDDRTIYAKQQFGDSRNRVNDDKWQHDGFWAIREAEHYDEKRLRDERKLDSDRCKRDEYDNRFSSHRSREMRDNESSHRSHDLRDDRDVNIMGRDGNYDWTHRTYRNDRSDHDRSIADDGSSIRSRDSSRIRSTVKNSEVNRRQSKGHGRSNSRSNDRSGRSVEKNTGGSVSKGGRGWRNRGATPDLDGDIAKKRVVDSAEDEIKRRAAKINEMKAEMKAKKLKDAEEDEAEEAKKGEEENDKLVGKPGSDKTNSRLDEGKRVDIEEEEEETEQSLLDKERTRRYVAMEKEFAIQKLLKKSKSIHHKNIFIRKPKRASDEKQSNKVKSDAVESSPEGDTRQIVKGLEDKEEEVDKGSSGALSLVFEADKVTKLSISSKTDNVSATSKLVKGVGDEPSRMYTIPYPRHGQSQVNLTAIPLPTEEPPPSLEEIPLPDPGGIPLPQTDLTDKPICEKSTKKVFKVRLHPDVVNEASEDRKDSERADAAKVVGNDGDSGKESEASRADGTDEKDTKKTGAKGKAAKEPIIIDESQFKLPTRGNKAPKEDDSVPDEDEVTNLSLKKPLGLMKKAFNVPRPISLKVTESSAKLIQSGLPAPKPDIKPKVELEEGEVKESGGKEGGGTKQSGGGQESSSSDSDSWSEPSSSGEISDDSADEPDHGLRRKIERISGKLSDDKDKRRRRKDRKRRRRSPDRSHKPSHKSRTDRSRRSSRSRDRRHRSRSHSRKRRSSRDRDRGSRSRDRRMGSRERRGGAGHRRSRRSRTRSRSRDRHFDEGGGRDYYDQQPSYEVGRERGAYESGGGYIYDRFWGKYRDRSRSRDRDGSRRGRGGRSRERSRDRGSSRDRGRSLKFNKEQLKAIAMARVHGGGTEEAYHSYLKAMEREQVDKYKSGKMSREDFTRYCQKLARKGDQSDSEDEAIAEKLRAAVNEENFRHPFAVRQNAPIKFNIENARQLPALSHQEKSQLRLNFPVSSGAKHKETAKEEDEESEWVPVEKTVATDRIPSLEGDLRLKPVREEDKVYEEDEVEETNIDIGQAMKERAEAVYRLESNPVDVVALGMMHRAQDKLNKWNKAKTLPGQFTGSTGVQVLKRDELAGGQQPWLNKSLVMFFSSPIIAAAAALISGYHQSLSSIDFIS